MQTDVCALGTILLLWFVTVQCSLAQKINAESRYVSHMIVVSAEYFNSKIESQPIGARK